MNYETFAFEEIAKTAVIDKVPVSAGFMYIPEKENLDNFTSRWSEKINESLKGEAVKSVASSFEDETLEEHPFDFQMLSDLCTEFGLLNSVVDTYVDFIISTGLKVISDNEQVSDTLNKFIREKNLKLILRPWIKDGILGNGFLEIAKDETGMPSLFKSLRPNSMFVKRDKKMNVLGYKQIISIDMKGKSSLNLNNIPTQEGIDFEIDEILHFKCNPMGDSAYGYGLVYSALGSINYLIKANKEKHLLLSRKANSPIHVQIGDAASGRIPTPETVTAYGQKLHYMNNKTEWCTDPYVNMKVLDFGNISDKFAGIIDEDVRDFCYSLQIPEVILGKGSIPEGLAEVQLDVFQRKIISKQDNIGSALKEKIFDKVLESKSIYDFNYEVEWGEQTEKQRREEVTSLIEVLKLTPLLNPAIKKALERKYIDLMGLEVDEEEFEAGANQQIAQMQQAEIQPQSYFGQQQKTEQPAETPKEETKQEMQDVVTTQVSKISGIDAERAMNILAKVSSGETSPDLAKTILVSIGFTEGQANQMVNYALSFKPKTESTKKKLDEDCKCHFCETKKYKDIELSREVKENIIRDYSLKEWVGFDYTWVKESIKKIIEQAPFDDLAAETTSDLNLGYLDGEQIEKLKMVLKQAFDNGWSTKQTALAIRQELNLPDLTVEVPKTDSVSAHTKTLPADYRSELIAKTELANMAFFGALQDYEDYDIEKVIWHTSGLENVCPICDNLDDSEMTISEARDWRAEIHPNCNCFSTPLVEGLNETINADLKEYVKYRNKIKNDRPSKKV